MQSGRQTEREYITDKTLTDLILGLVARWSGIRIKLHIRWDRL